MLLQNQKHKSYEKAKEAEFQKISIPSAKCTWWKAQGMRKVFNYSYCYSIEDDPNIFQEAIQSRDVYLEKKQWMMKCHQLLKITLGC